jgi:hypothetical protein
MNVRRSLVLGFALIAGVHLLYGQGTARIVGVVTDSGGGLVPGAQVILINDARGLRETAPTDEGGRYNFTQLAVGDYRIEVSKPGFKKETRTGINLVAEQVYTADLTLEVGNVNESVEVSSSAAMVETAVSSVGATVRPELIEDLPLNGRDALSLQTLVPGSVNQPGARVSLSEENGIAVNGARGSDNNVILDGGSNVDVYTGTPASLPNPDALQEFSVVSSSFDSEYGRSAGSLVSAVIKSGTNAYHGSAYDYLRNDVMDAHQFFFGGTFLPKNPLKQNQFGASVGGPIKRDKSFLFFSWESLRNVQSSPGSAGPMPTALEVAGDFSQSKNKPIDPTTGQAFMNNMIPASQISKPAVTIANLLFPLPNAPGNILNFNAPGSQNINQYVLRFDHSFTDRDRLNISYFYNDNYLVSNFGLPFEEGYSHWTNDHMAANYTKILSPTKVNSFTYTFNFLHFQRNCDPIDPAQYPGGSGVAPGFRFQDAGVMTVPSDPKYVVSTRFGSIAGYFGTNGNTYFDVTPSVHEFRDSLTITLGSHLIKLGGEFSHTEAYRHENISADGSTYNWGGSIANNGWAEYLLGRPNQFSQESSTVRTDSIYNSVAAFIQDDWKVRRNLTVNLGLRWEPSLGVIDGNGETTAFRPGERSVLYPNAPLGLVFPGDPGINAITHPRNWVNLAPRVGFAWLPFGPESKTSIRGAYGIFYNTERDYLENETQIVQPFVLNLNVVENSNPHGFVDPWAIFPGGDPFPYVAPTSAAGRAAIQFILPAQIQRFFGPDWHTPYNQQWNFSIQRQIPWNTVVSAAYVGSKATHLVLNVEQDPAVFIPGNGANGQPLSTTGNINARRINTNFSTINEAYTGGNSNYNSLQVSVNRRFVKGVTVNLSYTWSKALDYESLDRNASLPQNPLNLRPEYGPADFDHRHVFFATFLAEIPLPGKSGLVSRFTQGWQVNGIFRYISGDVLTVNPGVDTVLNGDAVGNERVNIGGSPLASTGAAFNQLYLNTASFVKAPLGAFGNEGRNAFNGPGNWNFDASFFKVTRVTERAKLEYRFEAFNALNHPQFGNPSTNFSAGTFGKITTVATASTATGARVLQMGLKLIF